MYPTTSVRLLQGKDSAKYAYEDSYKEKTSKPRKRCQPSTTIKAPRPSLTKVRIIYPSFGTLELWKVLTWLFEGIWPAPHQCSLWGLLFFVLCRYCFELVGTVWLTVDFLTSSIGVFSCLIPPISLLLARSFGIFPPPLLVFHRSYPKTGFLRVYVLFRLFHTYLMRNRLSREPLINAKVETFVILIL